MSERTIWYEVADLSSPSAEPFVVIRIDTAERRGAGCEGVIHSLHWMREDAEREAHTCNGGSTS